MRLLSRNSSRAVDETIIEILDEEVEAVVIIVVTIAVHVLMFREIGDRTSKFVCCVFVRVWWWL